MFLADFYKVGHINQYKDKTTRIWDNWTARASRVAGAKGTINFGMTYFLKKYLVKYFKDNFFDVPLNLILAEYREFIQNTLGVAEPRTDHIEALHKLGFLPITIYSLPEGTLVPIGVPSFIIVNDKKHPDFFWVPNFLETLTSMCIWKPMTSATTARDYRIIGLKYAREAGETDFGFIDWQFHDFSMRGMSFPEDAMGSGMGHLTQFSGTDTMPAIWAANKYYGAGFCGGSIPATEHSVMCAGGKEDELETFRRLITETYPSGHVSIVSDTWDLWEVLTKHVPALKDQILARNGNLVIRPDSGDPVKIICGDPGAIGPAHVGVLDLIRKAVGVTERPGQLPMLNKMAAIYGDSITPLRAETILSKVVHELKLSPYNQVFGVGSFTYEYVTRDTYSFAMKATACENNGVIIPIFKDPVTDNGMKKSAKGILAVYNSDEGYQLKQEATEDELDHCAFEKVFVNGEILVDPNFQTIRDRARAGL